MKSLLLILTSALFIHIAACGSYSKECWEDVCKITEDGQVRYEGNQEKIKTLVAQDKARLQAKHDREMMYQNLPRRKASETIRVGVMLPESNYADISRHRGQFYQWMLTTLGKDPRIQVIPHNQMKSYLSMVKTEIPITKGWDQDGPRSKRVVVPNQQTYRQLRDLGLKIDVLLYTSLSPKTQSGLVGGKGQGVGVISASRIEISGIASSIYDFKAYRHAVIGKSAGQIDIAGRDKEGEVKTASIKNSSRNIKLDKPAMEAYAKYFQSVIKTQISPHLPSLESLQGL